MSERTRIRKIQVSKLFGIFDHEIPLNLDERITIIHGPNGYGKTVILQMLEGLFSGRWDLLCHVPFSELVVEFENGGIVWVKQEVPETPKEEMSLAEKPSRALVCSYVDSVGAELRAFRYEAPSGLTRADVVHRKVDDPVWMRGLREQLDVYLIHTERLSVMDDFEHHELAVNHYSERIANEVKTVLATYASHSQELDSTFLNRLLQQGTGRPLSLKVIHARLKKIETKRSRLMALGFLDQERETHKPPPKLDEGKRDVLSVYIDDTERKLGVFDDMARKVQLLTDAVNKRFKYKRMRVLKDEGFIFESAAGGERISLDSLSSGEQHELVLLCELLFDVKPDTLVLVDEPEISLHLAWQQQFLGDLVEMVKLSSFDVLIATHSPGIIGKRWDLTVELKGPDL
jgi:predicted ATP-dependent endonuclease of OLD family